MTLLVLQHMPDVKVTVDQSLEEGLLSSASSAVRSKETLRPPLTTSEEEAGEAPMQYEWMK